MVGAGLLMILLAGISLYLVLTGKTGQYPKFLKVLLWAIPLPYLANSSGWLLAEVGRQPWVVYGLMKTADGVSQVVSPGTILFSLLTFTLVYGVLMAVDVYLLAKYARKGVSEEGESPQVSLTAGAVLEGEV
jgi:cytochrome d ubiquinol oxidase subunit I